MTLISIPQVKQHQNNEHGLVFEEEDNSETDSFVKMYEQRLSSEKGRHLIAARSISSGNIVAVERPLLSLQSFGNTHTGVLVCRYCRAFVGGPKLCLAVASGRVAREDIWDFNNEIDDLDMRMVPCRNKCGEVYCSRQCEEVMWKYRGHDLLCTGLILESTESENSNNNNSNTQSDEKNAETTSDQETELIKEEDKKNPLSNLSKEKGEEEHHKNHFHPLLQFKIHALQNNEILLMVADLVATVISLRRQQIILSSHKKDTNTNSQDSNQRKNSHSFSENTDNTTLNVTQEIPSGLEKLMEPYLDFTLVPWWEVATAPLGSTSDGQKEAITLDQCLRQMCRESARLLKEAILCEDITSKYGDPLLQAVQECEEHYHIFSSENFFGKIIGSFEQNSMGIRVRHPLGLNLLSSPNLRSECHDDLLRCLEISGMISNDECDREGCNSDEEIDDSRIEENENNSKSTENEKESKFDYEDIETNGDYEEDEYSVDAIAAFLARLEIDEEVGKGSSSSNRRNNTNEEDVEAEDSYDCDDLDLIFTPFDGTAMYYTTCKMNHSCEPNIVARYAPRRGWGRKNPLTVQCIALTDIAEGEELCISYIQSDAPLEERQAAIANYGFSCTCAKCLSEKSDRKRLCDIDNEKVQNDSQKNNLLTSIDDTFGGEDYSDVEDNLFGSSDDDSSFSDNKNDETDDEICEGEVLLSKKLKKLDASFSLSRQGSLPIEILTLSSLYVIQNGKLVIQAIESYTSNIERKNASSDSNHKIEHGSDAVSIGEKIKDLLQQCIIGIQEKDFCRTCIDAGSEGEQISLQFLFRRQSWPHDSFRQAYFCLALTASIGYIHSGCFFLSALELLDKCAIFGLFSGNNSDVKELMKYVVHHTSSCVNLQQHKYQEQTLDYYELTNTSKNSLETKTIIADYRLEIFQKEVLDFGLSAPINFPMEEIKVENCAKLNSVHFNQLYVRPQKPVVIRNYAMSWKALQKWRNLNYFVREYGHRLVPIEVGIMNDKDGMKEKIIYMENFVRDFLVPSIQKLCWPLIPDGKEKTDNKSTSQKSIAYLAQHELFTQIPELMNHIESSPRFCGESGPAHMNVWMGTGGTRTPLHYDSFDNLFVQVVGTKYVRIYSKEETYKLNAMTACDKIKSSSYGKQGNMSAYNCEIDDMVETGTSCGPQTDQPIFKEVVMFPGDCLFIPARAWHYVRSLSTSISVNYWW